MPQTFLTRRQTLALSATALAISALPRPTRAQNSPVQSKRPNILYVTADDLGEQVGCYGDPIARTPNIDALAATGARFSNAYVTQASCSPSRSSLLTGLYPHQNGQVGLVGRGYSMKEGVATLPTLLHDAGYRTGIIGKLHVLPEAAFAFDYAETAVRPTLQVRNVARQAHEFIEATPKDQPFFLYVNYFDPHAPFYKQIDGLPLDPFEASDVKPLRFNDINAPDALAKVADFTNGATRMDAGLGMMMDVLKQTGHYENTIIVFIGDHGAPFPRGKTSCYEGGVRVPLVTKIPGQTKAGQTVDALVSAVDIVPTLLQSARVEKKIETAGAPLQPLLKGDNSKARKYLVTEYYAHTSVAFYPRRSIRDGRYKLIRNLIAPAPNPVKSMGGTTRNSLRPADFVDERAYRGYKTLISPPAEELYDLKNDPNEWNNLAGRAQFARKQDELRAALHDWQEQTDDPLRHSAEVVKAVEENAAHQKRDAQTRDKKEKED